MDQHDLPSDHLFLELRTYISNQDQHLAQKLPKARSRRAGSSDSSFYPRNYDLQSGLQIWHLAPIPKKRCQSALRNHLVSHGLQERPITSHGDLRLLDEDLIHRAWSEGLNTQLVAIGNAVSCQKSFVRSLTSKFHTTDMCDLAIWSRWIELNVGMWRPGVVLII